MNALWDAALTVFIIAAVISLGEWMRRRTKRRLAEERLARREYADKLVRALSHSAEANLLWKALQALHKFGPLEIRVDYFRDSAEVAVQYYDPEYAGGSLHEAFACEVDFVKDEVRIFRDPGGPPPEDTPAAHEPSEVCMQGNSLILRLAAEVRGMGVERLSK